MSRQIPAHLSRPQLRAPRRKLEDDVPYFGTLDTTNDITGVEEIDSPDTLNTVYDKIQSVGTRKGYTKLLTTKTPSFIGNMYGMYKSDGTRKLLYASSANIYTYDNAGGSTLVSGTPTNFTADKQWDFDEYMDQVYGGNGYDPLISFNGTSYSIANAGITPQFVKIHKNRVYCANRNSSTLYFSDAGNPTSFPVNNFIQINTNDGQNITGIEEVLDNLIITKDDSVWILTGDPLGAGNLTTIGNLQLRRANGTGGCSAFKTLQRVGQSLFMMHYSGIYALQNYSLILVSDKLSKTFKQDMNPGFINLSWAVYSEQEKKYIMGYPSATSTVPDSALVYDFLVKGFTHWDHLPGNCGITYKFSGLTESILMGDPTVGNIYQLLQGYSDIAGDNGTTTGGSTTTLVDSTKSWTSNQFVDCRVMIGNNLGNYTTATVQSNTSTTLTFTTTLSSAVSSGTQYSIGFYTSYWTTNAKDFGMTGYSKKYRFFNLFCDSQLYNILFGSSIDFQPLNFQKSFNLTSGALTWGQMGLLWGPTSGVWGSFASEFGQANIGSTGRYCQFIFGNNLANQPWRAIHYSVSYKLKKMRPNVVTI
jgi:Fe-S cluster assembly iron-binding protein IscA